MNILSIEKILISKLVDDWLSDGLSWNDVYNQINITKNKVVKNLLGNLTKDEIYKMYLSYILDFQNNSLQFFPSFLFLSKYNEAKGFFSKMPKEEWKTFLNDMYKIKCSLNQKKDFLQSLTNNMTNLNIMSYNISDTIIDEIKNNYVYSSVYIDNIFSLNYEKENIFPIIRETSSFFSDIKYIFLKYKKENYYVKSIIIQFINFLNKDFIMQQNNYKEIKSLLSIFLKEIFINMPEDLINDINDNDNFLYFWKLKNILIKYNLLTKDTLIELKLSGLQPEVEKKYNMFISDSFSLKVANNKI